MKKIFIFILGLLFLPILNVDALKCYNKVIDLKSDINNFECTNVEGNTITFKNGENKEDITNKFDIEFKTDNKIGVTILDRNITFNKTKKTGEIIISDGKTETLLLIKNGAYVAPTTTTQPTTTKDANTKTFTVTLDPNNGDELTKKTCDVNNNNTICSITLPNLENSNFNGWGTAQTCKEGKIGTIRVDKDITYYACYKNNSNTTSKITTVKTTTIKTITKNESVTTTTSEETKEIYLKSLTLTDKDTEEKIEFGTFSIKKNEYDFKVLYEVENIVVNAEAEEGIEIEISGNENLSVGENKIIIKLKSDEITKEYILNVTRLEEGQKINNTSFLKTLDVGGFNIGFNKEKINYDLTIPSDINELQIIALGENEDDVISINGNTNADNKFRVTVNEDSLITITVNPESENQMNYYINITKEKKVNIMLIGAIILIGVLVIALVVLIIIKSNKSKTNSNKKEKNKDSLEVLNL